MVRLLCHLVPSMDEPLQSVQTVAIVGVRYIIVVFSVVMWILLKITSSISTEAAQNQAYTSLTKYLLNVWAIILGTSSSNFPPDVVAIRAVFFGWVLYCWAVNTVYQAHLTIFLIGPGLQQHLSSEDEILTSGIDYSTSTSMMF